MRVPPDQMSARINPIQQIGGGQKAAYAAARD